MYLPKMWNQMCFLRKASVTTMALPRSIAFLCVLRINMINEYTLPIGSFEITVWTAMNYPPVFFIFTIVVGTIFRHWSVWRVFFSINPFQFFKFVNIAIEKSWTSLSPPQLGLLTPVMAEKKFFFDCVFFSQGFIVLWYTYFSMCNRRQNAISRG